MTNPVPFTNEFGTAHPGDEVAVLTVRAGSEKLFKATYVGLHKNGSVQVDHPENMWAYYDNETGEKITNPYTDSRYLRGTYKSVPGVRRITLQLNRIVPLPKAVD